MTRFVGRLRSLSLGMLFVALGAGCPPADDGRESSDSAATTSDPSCRESCTLEDYAQRRAEIWCTVYEGCGILKHLYASYDECLSANYALGYDASCDFNEQAAIGCLAYLETLKHDCDRSDDPENDACSHVCGGD